jgi:release factor glutamine methyltransferase
MNNVRAFNDLLTKLAASWQALPDKPEETAEETLRALCYLAAGDPRCIERAAQAELPLLSETGWVHLNGLVEKRMAGVPLAHLTGRQQFMGIEMLAGPEALIPRTETEILGNAALEKLEPLILERGSAVIIDLCTGSGNLALALAYHVSQCRVFGSDLSPEAVELARRNARHLGLQERVEFREGDFFAPFESAEFVGQVDTVVCNPPYISSANVEVMPDEISGYEPRLAFDGGRYGTEFMFRLVREAHRFLKPDSWLCFEVGWGQGKVMEAKSKRAGHYRNVQSVCNAEGQIRAILAQTDAANTTSITAK